MRYAPAQIRKAKLSDLFTAADGLQVGRLCSPRHRLKAREESFSAMCLRPKDSATLSNALQLTARVVVFGVHVKSEWRQARERILSA